MDPVIRGTIENKVDEYVSSCAINPKEMSYVKDIIPVSKTPIEFVLGYHIGRMVEIIYRNSYAMDSRYSPEIKQQLIQEILEAKVPGLYKQIQTKLNK